MSPVGHAPEALEDVPGEDGHEEQVEPQVPVKMFPGVPTGRLKTRGHFRDSDSLKSQPYI